MGFLNYNPGKGKGKSRGVVTQGTPLGPHTLYRERSRNGPLATVGIAITGHLLGTTTATPARVSNQSTRLTTAAKGGTGRRAEKGKEPSPKAAGQSPAAEKFGLLPLPRLVSRSSCQRTGRKAQGHPRNEPAQPVGGGVDPALS